MKIFDISLPLNEQTITYPWTIPLDVVPTRSSVTGSALSEITISSHGGAHIDAPSHVIEKGKTIEGLNLAEVNEGEYELVAFPLAFTGIDGSSARAVLID